MSSLMLMGAQNNIEITNRTPRSMMGSLNGVKGIPWASSFNVSSGSINERKLEIKAIIIDRERYLLVIHTKNNRRKVNGTKAPEIGDQVIPIIDRKKIEGKFVEPGFWKIISIHQRFSKDNKTRLMLKDKPFED